jgi:hypothetical protein
MKNIKNKITFKNICSLLLIFYAVLSLSSNAHAREKFGVGFILGYPSGATGKFFIDSANAIDCGLGDPMSSGVYVYTDYLRHFLNLFPKEEFRFYLGAGAGFHFLAHRHNDDGENEFGIRMPFGIEYMVGKIPLGIFLELVPTLGLVPDVRFHFMGGAGARYFF